MSNLYIFSLERTTIVECVNRLKKKEEKKRRLLFWIDVDFNAAQEQSLAFQTKTSQFPSNELYNDNTYRRFRGIYRFLESNIKSLRIAWALYVFF